MKYMGSKARIAKHILPVILSGIKPEQHYIELFVGGANLIDKVKHKKRLGNDVNPYLIAMWKELQKGWIPPEWVSKEEYEDVKKYKDALYSPHFVGWCCFCVSYSGKPFSGFAGLHTPTTGIQRNYQKETYNYVLNQIENLKDVIFTSLSYDKVSIPCNSIVYCDPPYKGTAGYMVKFNHCAFWDFCRNISKENTVFISEYDAPKDFYSVWSGSLKGSLNKKGIYSGSRYTVEKLFVHESKLTYELL